MLTNIQSHTIRFQYGISLLLLAFFLTAQTATLWHIEIHDFHDHDEYCETFDNLEKQSVIIDTSSVLIEVIPPLSECLIIMPCHFVQASVSAYDSRAPPI